MQLGDHFLGKGFLQFIDTTDLIGQFKIFLLMVIDNFLLVFDRISIGVPVDIQFSGRVDLVVPSSPTVRLTLAIFCVLIVSVVLVVDNFVPIQRGYAFAGAGYFFLQAVEESRFPQIDSLFGSRRDEIISLPAEACDVAVCFEGVLEAALL